MAKSVVTPERFARGMTFEQYVTYTGSPENLAREAFGTAPRFEQIDRVGIEGVDGRRDRDAATRGRTIRLVASCKQVGDQILASVRPEELPDKDPLAQTTEADNCLEIKTEIDHPVVLRGKGAGRWPTTEAILADLFDIRSNLWSHRFGETAARPAHSGMEECA